MDGYRQAVAGREDEFPLLARAVENLEPAQNVRIEWDGGWNFQQIVRWPFEMTGAAMIVLGIPEGAENDHPEVVGRRDEFLTKTLQSIEDTLWNGKRSVLKTHATTCGGVRELLGRDPAESDRIALRPLRDLQFTMWTREDGGMVGEWLAEFSLEARPA